jgi:hypothetical protein
MGIVDTVCRAKKEYGTETERMGHREGMRRAYLHSSPCRASVVVVAIVQGVDSTRRRAPRFIDYTVWSWPSP